MTDDGGPVPASSVALHLRCGSPPELHPAQRAALDALAGWLPKVAEELRQYADDADEAARTATREGSSE